MFARQIAVMKGQAWNVVETLKHADHGPLELTRRTRVCVWDDLVDVPVAIPMRTPSVETARLKQAAKKKRHDEEQEEMDIGVGQQSSAPVDLLLGSPTSELPNPHRFELARDENLGDLGRVSESGEMTEPSSPLSISVVDFVDSDAQAREAKNNLSTSLTTSNRPRHKSRFSFEFARPTFGKSTLSSSMPGGGGRRQRSMSTRSGGFNKRPPHHHMTANDLFYEGDDLEGDLGYSAASDMEGRTRKVIVERLEAVKSKNPVFTWC